MSANLFSDRIEAFLASGPFAVAGASQNRLKFGNKVLRCYRQHGLQVFPINPRETEIEELACYPNVGSLPERVHGLSIVTPPSVTKQVIDEAADSGIRHFWIQPGAEDPTAVERAESLGLSVIWGGPCILVQLGFRDEP